MTQYDMSMRRTIYLPDDLDKRVEEHLQLHRKNLSALVQEALEERLRPRDPWAILELAGIVKDDGGPLGERPEDDVPIEPR